jgi:hypothetical protein
VGSSEHGNEPSGSTGRGGFLISWATISFSSWGGSVGGLVQWC